MLAHFDFIFCGPDAFFQTPFMASCQSPEGASTLLFPKQLGVRRSREILMLDRVMYAQEAVDCGWSNGIVKGLGPYDWFDARSIPAIGKILDSDYRTIVESKKLMIAAKNVKEIEDTINREATALIDTWLEPDFPEKMMNFMQKLFEEKEAKKEAKR
jgi:enoyl-CoA hydratase/carnithine racemase